MGHSRRWHRALGQCLLVVHFAEQYYVPRWMRGCRGGAFRSPSLRAVRRTKFAYAFAVAVAALVAGCGEGGQTNPRQPDQPARLGYSVGRPDLRPRRPTSSKTLSARPHARTRTRHERTSRRLAERSQSSARGQVESNGGHGNLQQYSAPPRRSPTAEGANPSSAKSGASLPVTPPVAPSANGG